MNYITTYDRFVGCLLGGACGDALGYPVEFLSKRMIDRIYGNNGIVKFSLEKGSGVAAISDDTQMTLFTANGLLLSKMRETDLDGIQKVVFHTGRRCAKKIFKAPYKRA